MEIDIKPECEYFITMVLADNKPVGYWTTGSGLDFYTSMPFSSVRSIRHVDDCECLKTVPTI